MSKKTQKPIIWPKEMDDTRSLSRSLSRAHTRSLSLVVALPLCSQSAEWRRRSPARDRNHPLLQRVSRVRESFSGGGRQASQGRETGERGREEEGKRGKCDTRCLSLSRRVGSSIRQTNSFPLAQSGQSMIEGSKDIHHVDPLTRD